MQSTPLFFSSNCLAMNSVQPPSSTSVLKCHHAHCVYVRCGGFFQGFVNLHYRKNGRTNQVNLALL